MRFFSKYKLDVTKEVNGWKYHIWRWNTTIVATERDFPNPTKATEEGIKIIEQLRALDKLKKRKGV